MITVVGLHVILQGWVISNFCCVKQLVGKFVFPGQIAGEVFNLYFLSLIMVI